MVTTTPPLSKRHQPKYSFPTSGEHVPEDKDQRLVQTPYGKGLVIRTRKQQPIMSTILPGHLPHLQEVQLMDWPTKASASAARGPIRPAMLYSPVDFPSVAPAVGDDVITMYGRGKVLEIRRGRDDDADADDESAASSTNNNIVVVLISSWRLAGRSRVTCYLAPQHVQVVRAKKLYEMTVYEKVEHATELKNQAAVQFRAKDYANALQTYSKAVDAVRYVQHSPNSTNQVRADLLTTMITCSNNAGTCCVHLKQDQWDEQAFQFAKNAAVLLDALESKGSKSKIHKILNREGYLDIKLFGEWRVKSLVLQAQALMEKGEHVQAMEILKQAHQVIAKYTGTNATTTSTTDSSSTVVHEQQQQHAVSVKQLAMKHKEVKKLHALCKDQKKAQLKKEKQRAQAMFGAGNNGSSPTNGTNTINNRQDDDKENAAAMISSTLPLSSSSAASSSSSPKSSPSSSSDKQNNNNTPAGTTATTETTATTTTSNDKRSKLKKTVSFSKEVVEKDEAKVAAAAAAATSRRAGSHGDSGEDDDELEWYQDPEVVTGLAIFAGTVVGTMVGLSYLLSSSSKK